MSEQLKQRVTEMFGEISPEGFMFKRDSRLVWDSKTKRSVYNIRYDHWSNIVAELMDHYGGEGQGDLYWTVWKFTEGDESVLVKFSGWYASYSGAEYKDWFFVEPKQKVVTVYE